MAIVAEDRWESGKGLAMNDAIETIELDGFRGEVVPDDGNCSPAEWDNISDLVTFDRYGRCTSGKYQPDHQSFTESMDGSQRGDYKGQFVSKPLAVEVGGIRDGWAYVVADPAKCLREYGKYWRRKCLPCLKGEAKDWEAYYNGEVYGVRILDANGDHVDSCYGFYGYDYAKGECASMLKAVVEAHKKATDKRLAERPVTA